MRDIWLCKTNHVIWLLFKLYVTLVKWEQLSLLIKMTGKELTWVCLSISIKGKYYLCLLNVFFIILFIILKHDQHSNTANILGFPLKEKLFWKMVYNNTHAWVHSHVQEKEPINMQTLPAIRRTIPDTTGWQTAAAMAMTFIGTVFFRHTLGFKYNQVINTSLTNGAQPGSITSPTDACGKNPPTISLKMKQFTPVPSNHTSIHSLLHYHITEWDHASNRKYFLPELTLVQVYSDFKQKRPGVCKKKLYNKTLKSMNIGN